MRVAALSDFHIGVSSRADSFGHREECFLRLLDELEATHDRIVVLGDVFQTDHGWVWGRSSQRRQLHRASKRVARLAARLQEPGYLYVFGNHDRVAETELGAREWVRLEADGLAMLFIHGHQLDPLLTTIRPLSNLSTYLMGRLRFFGLKRGADWFERWDVDLKNRRYGEPDGPYARGAARLAALHSVDVVCMAHTHCACLISLVDGARFRAEGAPGDMGRVEPGERLMANTGACRLGAWSHVSIDTSTRVARLVRRRG
jgi:UDP-2,3-diacylglucosamine pyrophosphatase LpxH